MKVIQHSQFGSKPMWICQKRNCSKQSVKLGKAPSLKKVSHFWNSSNALPEIFQQENKKSYLFDLILFFRYNYEVQNTLKVGIFDTKNI